MKVFGIVIIVLYLIHIKHSCTDVTLLIHTPFYHMDFP